MKTLLLLALVITLDMAIAAEPIQRTAPIRKPVTPHRVIPDPVDAQHVTAVQIYAHALEVNIFVENNCPGLKVNANMLDQLGAWAQLRADRDLDTMTRERQIIVNLFNEKKDQVGTELWCWGIKNFYGPEGNVIKGLIENGDHS